MAKLEEPLVQVTKEGLRVISEQTAKELKRKKLSASLISGLQGCPASWLSNSFVIPKIVDQQPDNPARRGSLFHQVMENFFALAPEERTHEAMRQEVKNVLASDEYRDLQHNREVVLWLRDAVNGYYNMKADTDPADVTIAKIRDEKGQLKSGLEIFVQGQIGKAKRKTLGFVDRVTEVEAEELKMLETDETVSELSATEEVETNELASKKVIVEDWKSGAKAKQYNPKSRSKNPEGINEQRQQFIYSILLEQQYGVEVESARLIYPVARQVVTVDLTDEKLREKVIKDVEAADTQLDNHIERNLFDYSPSILCSWCPLYKICPEAKSFNHVEKARKAAESQPTAKELSEGFEFTQRR